MKIATADRQPGVRAHDESVTLPFGELVSRLRDILGVKLVAIIGGVKGSRSVTAWADGETMPGADDQQRLRHAYHVAAMLRERFDPITVQSWFMGMNPMLDDEAPALVLRESDPLDPEIKFVIGAARRFVAVG